MTLHHHPALHRLRTCLLLPSCCGPLTRLRAACHATTGHSPLLPSPLSSSARLRIRGRTSVAPWRRRGHRRGDTPNVAAARTVGRKAGALPRTNVMFDGTLQALRRASFMNGGCAVAERGGGTRCWTLPRICAYIPLPLPLSAGRSRIFAMRAEPLPTYRGAMSAIQPHILPRAALLLAWYAGDAR